MPEDKRDKGPDPGFKVSDRRSFVDRVEVEVPLPVPEPTAASDAGGGADERNVDPGDLPPVDFHTFILSLGSSALLHLGELDQPDGHEAGADLRLAKHTIDIIGMLQEKTRGNLSPPEERLIESLLYDLRLRYVEKDKK